MPVGRSAPASRGPGRRRPRRIAGGCCVLLAVAVVGGLLVTAPATTLASAPTVDDGDARCKLDDPRVRERRMVFVTNNFAHTVQLHPAAPRLLPGGEAAVAVRTLPPHKVVAFYAMPGDVYRVVGVDRDGDGNGDGADAGEGEPDRGATAQSVKIGDDAQTHFRLGAPYVPLNQSQAGFRPARGSAVAAKFRNYLPFAVDVHWLRASDQKIFNYQTLRAGEEASIASYEDHVFLATRKGAPGSPGSDSNPVLARLTMAFDQVVYGIGNGGDPKEAQFLEDYYAANKVHYLHNYPPRGPATWPFWDCATVGTTYHVPTEWTFAESCGAHDFCAKNFAGTPYATLSAAASGASTAVLEKEEDDDEAGQPERTAASAASTAARPPAVALDLELRVISSFPKALEIKHFLSAFEADHIRGMAEARLRDSTTYGSREGTEVARTSTTTWLSRRASRVADVVYRRVADVIGIPETHLFPDKSAEEMQIVHYSNGQQYQPHHDWVMQGKGNQSRFLTLLLYLTDRPGTNGTAGTGGTTDFPKAFGGAGLSVHPERGTAVLFYDMLEDGNVDDLSLHGAAAVQGRGAEKFLANVWVWDPTRPQPGH